MCCSNACPARPDRSPYDAHVRHFAYVRVQFAKRPPGLGVATCFARVLARAPPVGAWLLESDLAADTRWIDARTAPLSGSFDFMAFPALARGAALLRPATSMLASTARTYSSPSRAAFPFLSGWMPSGLLKQTATNTIVLLLNSSSSPRRDAAGRA